MCKWNVVLWIPSAIWFGVLKKMDMPLQYLTNLATSAVPANILKALKEFAYKIYIIDVSSSEIYQSLKILREMNAMEVARKYPATKYKFLVYWILKARNVGMN